MTYQLITICVSHNLNPVATPKKHFQLRHQWARAAFVFFVLFRFFCVTDYEGLKAAVMEGWREEEQGVKNKTTHHVRCRRWTLLIQWWLSFFVCVFFAPTTLVGIFFSPFERCPFPHRAPRPLSLDLDEFKVCHGVSAEAKAASIRAWRSAAQPYFFFLFFFFNPTTVCSGRS